MSAPRRLWAGSLLLLGLLAGCASGPPPLERPLPALEGPPLRLADELAQGQPLALVFWQSWCQPCAREAPAVARAAREQAGRVRFLGVIPGSEQKVDAAACARKQQEWGFSFRQARDTRARWVRAFKVRTTPTILVLAPDRRVLYRGDKVPQDWAALVKAAQPEETKSKASQPK